MPLGGQIGVSVQYNVAGKSCIILSAALLRNSTYLFLQTASGRQDSSAGSRRGLQLHTISHQNQETKGALLQQSSSVDHPEGKQTQTPECKSVRGAHALDLINLKKPWQIQHKTLEEPTQNTFTVITKFWQTLKPGIKEPEQGASELRILSQLQACACQQV